MATSAYPSAYYTPRSNRSVIPELVENPAALPPGFGGPMDWLGALAPTPVPGGAGVGAGGDAGISTGGGTTRVWRPGWTPDYSSLMRGDPMYLQYLSDLSSEGVSSSAQRAAAVRKALIAYGLIPEVSGLSAEQQGWFGADVDPSTRQAALANTQEGLSVEAQLDRTNERSRAGLARNLAARGMLDSGALGVGEGLEAERDKQARYTAANELLDYLGSAYAGFAQSERERQRALYQAQQEAFYRQVAQNPAAPGYYQDVTIDGSTVTQGSPPPAPPVPGTSQGDYGVQGPFYDSRYGEYYVLPNGQRIA